MTKNIKRWHLESYFLTTTKNRSSMFAQKTIFLLGRLQRNLKRQFGRWLNIFKFVFGVWHVSLNSTFGEGHPAQGCTASPDVPPTGQWQSRKKWIWWASQPNSQFYFAGKRRNLIWSVLCFEWEFLWHYRLQELSESLNLRGEGESPAGLQSVKICNRFKTTVCFHCTTSFWMSTERWGSFPWNVLGIFKEFIIHRVKPFKRGDPQSIWSVKSCFFPHF